MISYLYLWPYYYNYAFFFPKSSVEPIGKKVKTPVKENAELAKLAGVSETTLKRAKKVKKENPSAYEEVIKNNSGWSKAYAELPSVKIKKSADFN